jgi:hypothetical protein
MNTKKISELKFTASEKTEMVKSKPKSLRPMRSMVAVRSLKSRTNVAKMATPKMIDSLEKI